MKDSGRRTRRHALENMYRRCGSKYPPFPSPFKTQNPHQGTIPGNLILRSRANTSHPTLTRTLLSKRNPLYPPTRKKTPNTLLPQPPNPPKSKPSVNSPISAFIPPQRITIHSPTLSLNSSTTSTPSRNALLKSLWNSALQSSGSTTPST